MAKLDKLLQQAEAHLERDEKVLGAVQGAYETRIMGNDSVRTGILLATPRRLVFYAKKVGGFDLESFPYQNISSFEQGKNMMGHRVSFFASGNKVQVKWIKDGDGLAKLVEHIRGRMGKPASPTPLATTDPPAVNPMEQLRQLGELRDAGVLTPEEFEAKKAELLNRI